MKKNSLLAALGVVGASLTLGLFLVAGNSQYMQAQLLQNILDPVTEQVVDPILDPLTPTVNEILDPVSSLSEPILQELESILGDFDDLLIGDTLENLLVEVEDAGLPLDQLPPIEIDTSVFLGNESSVNPHIKLFIEEEQPVDIGVNYLIHGSTATPGEDFVPQIGTAIIRAGETEVAIPFDIINDTIEEPVEELLVTLFDPVNALLDDTTLELHLEDDDFLGLSVTPTCLNLNEGTGVYNVRLTGQPTDVVNLDLTPTNNVGIDLSSITISPSNWDTPQQITVEALEGTIYDTVSTGNVFLIANSEDTEFAGESVLPLDIFFSDQDQTSGDGLVNIDGCTLPLSCDPSDPDCTSDPSCDPTIQNCGGGGGDGGSQDSVAHDGYCLEMVDERDLTFLDLDEAFPNELPYLEVLRRTREVNQGQFVISGYANPEELSTQDLSNPDESFITYIGPRNNIIRLELAKVLLISHCYPILDATTLDETADGRPMANWSDLPREHNGDDVHDELVDIAYSGMYWGLWEGYRDNTIRIGDEVNTAEGIKMFVRIGEIVKQGHPVTFDDPSDQWWKDFYSKAKDEGTAVRLRNIMRVQDPINRGTGIVELVKGMLIRNMYQEEDRFEVLDHIIDNITGDPNADEKEMELIPETILVDEIVVLDQPLNILVPSEGNRVQKMKDTIMNIVPEYLATRERNAIAEYLAEKILATEGVENGRAVRLLEDGTVTLNPGVEVDETEETDEEENSEEEESPLNEETEEENPNFTF